MVRSESSESRKAPDFGTLKSVTSTPVQRAETLQFCGFLTREEDEAIYVADAQGTWILRRSDVVSVEDWTGEAVPEFMKGAGRPVRVAVKDGATIEEIRPWRIHRHAGYFPRPKVREAIQRIFTLGGAGLPVSDRTMLGEAQMAQLERSFARRIGWAPVQQTPGFPLIRGSQSMTTVLYNGY